MGSDPISCSGGGDPWRTAGIAFVVALAVAVGYFGPGIATGAATFFTHDGTLSDLWHLNVPLKKMLQDAYQRGALPFWSDEIGTGFPLFAEGQVGALYPPNLVLFGFLPLAAALNWVVLLHLAFCAGATALYARQVQLARGACVFGGLAFAFSAFFVLHVKHLNLAQSACWLPVLLYLVERWRAGGQRRTLVGFAVAVAVMVFAGHPQIAYQNLLVVGIYAALSLQGRFRHAGANRSLHGATRAPHGATRVAFAGGLCVALIVGLALAAVQLLPTAALAAESERRGGFSLAAASGFPFDLRYLWMFVDPFRFGDPGLVGAGAFEPFARPTFFWETCYFVGRSTLVLACLGLAVSWRRGAAWRLVVVGVLAFSIGSGWLVPLLHDWLPGFDRFRFHSRFFLYVAFVVVMLAGWGLDRIGRAVPRRWRVASVAVGIALVIGESFVAFGDHNPHIDPKRWLTPPDTVDAIRRAAPGEVPFRLADFDPHRLVFAHASRAARGWKGDLAPYDVAHRMLAPAQNALYGLTNLNHYHPLVPRGMDYVSRALSSPDPRTGVPPHIGVASLFNVRFVIAPVPTGAARQPRNGLRLLASFAGGNWRGHHRDLPFEIDVYENDRVLPRAFLARRAVRVEARPGVHAPGLSDAEAVVLATIAAADFNPRDTLLFAVDVAPPAGAASVGGLVGRLAKDAAVGGDAAIGSVAIRVDEDPTERVLYVEAARAAWLFVSDTPLAGWVATVNGRETPWWPANLSGRALRVPAGRSEVVFRYRPASVKYGLLLSALGVVALLLLAGWGGRGGRRSRALEELPAVP